MQQASFNFGGNSYFFFRIREIEEYSITAAKKIPKWRIIFMGVGRIFSRGGGISGFFHR